MKKIFLLLLAFALAGHLFAQDRITEADYLHADSLLWVSFYSASEALSEQRKTIPDKVDSLRQVYDRLLADALQGNIDLALEYAAVPSGLKRVYMVRMDVPKDTLTGVLDRLPDAMRTSEYGCAIRKHIDTHQLDQGDRIVPFDCVTDNGEPFDWNVFDDRRVLLMYGGMDCMGAGGRKYLESLYAGSDRGQFLIVVYWPVSSLENLRALRTQFPCDYLFVSDFKQDFSPMKIQYGTQATPTCFLTDSDGVIRLKSTGLDMERLNAELAGIVRDDAGK